MANDKVFKSDITRTHNKLHNNLYDLLKVDPVRPLKINAKKYLPCDFVPKTDKYFIPKRKVRPKVKTIREIRYIYENDVCSELSIDIEKQENVLLRKIKSGSSKDEKTKLFARNMLQSDKPISRISWQMIININPDNYAHSSQYILWNGKCVQINGSRGGKSKFIYKYDLGERRESLIERYKLKKNNLNKKKGLLKHSLHVKFKPGPLSRKKQLDVSYQKYNIGNIELVHLPKPGLEILSEYGKPIEVSVANFLHNLRDVNGTISEKWAEFAVSVLGTNDDGRAIKLNKDSCVTFDLGYEYHKRRLLMRYDIDKRVNELMEKQMVSKTCIENEEITKKEVQKMLEEMIFSVEISLSENNMYTGEDSPREFNSGDKNNSFDSLPKDKLKRKGQSELHRLDVTVIRLCDNQNKNENDACRKSFCTLGCICDSLLSSFRLKNHCGHIECMFECKCDFNKYTRHSCIEDDIIPELVSLDKEKNSKLSKEEQKFHQTVILSGEKSILLKSRRRNWKAPEKYADFYSNMCLKAKKDIKRILSVVEVKLNCGNIEPWCMIHNLYKCFCKGKFTEKLSNDASNDEIKAKENEDLDTNLCSLGNMDVDSNGSSNVSTVRTSLRPRIYRAGPKDVQSIKSVPDETDNFLNDCFKQCARVNAYRKRKYSDFFYINTHKKIMELEQNDQGLQKRLLEILKIDENTVVKKSKNDSGNTTADLSSPAILGQTNQIVDAEDKSTDKIQKKMTCDVITTQFTSPTECHLNRKLKAWLEPSLKLYRQRFSKGFFKESLEPPKAGKISLYPWDFIMNRYHDKKNLFLVTNQKPYRIYMAVDNRNSLFNNCIDISSIEDLDKYPVSVKNIITKEMDHLADQLCILRGLNFCWELVGSVKKVGDCKNQSQNDSTLKLSPNINTRSPDKSTLYTSLPTTPVKDVSTPVSLENNAEQSKWFVMTIENDFSEIQFYNRGFFVKYDSIIKAINVARVSDKTVRLSSQKCSEGSSDPQFGIYAIPNANEYCVFIGPYEKNQPLGIEILKTAKQDQTFKTRGVWITSNKVDNLRVIDNPLSFISQVDLKDEEILDVSSRDELTKDAVPTTDIQSTNKIKENKKVVKLLKPIKINKTNNLYHLTPSGLLKPISVSPEKQISKTPVKIKKPLSHDLDTSATNSSILRKTLLPQTNEISNKPIAEIAPLVKVTEERRVSTQHKTPGRKFEGGMFILKPEEINSRSLVNNMCFTSSPIENTNTILGNNEIDTDIENFLANSVECSAPTSDIFVISDDEEDYCNIETSNKKNWKDVWIICNSVKTIGWIYGRQDECGHLSFEFPGFKCTDFYPEEEAFSKITQVLARKVYIPDHVNLRWSVVKTKKELKKLHKLKQADLKKDFVLTKWGLKHKSLLTGHGTKAITDFINVPSNECTMSTQNSNGEDSMESNLMKSNLNDMEVEGNMLLEEGEQLLSQTILRSGELSDTISKMSNDRRQKISDRLRSIISSANCS